MSRLHSGTMLLYKRFFEDEFHPLLNVTAMFYAGTTEKIFETKEELYDVYVNNQNIKSKSYLSSIQHVNSCDKDRYKRLLEYRYDFCCFHLGIHSTSTQSYTANEIYAYIWIERFFQTPQKRQANGAFWQWTCWIPLAFQNQAGLIGLLGFWFGIKYSLKLYISLSRNVFLQAIHLLS